MKNQLLVILAMTGLFCGCKQTGLLSKNKQKHKHKSVSSVSIIPNPVSVKHHKGQFQLTPATTIQVPARSERAHSVGVYLKKKITQSTGYFNMPLTTSPVQVDSNRIMLTLAADTTGFGNSEGYKLHISHGKVVIKAPTPHGLFNGAQSLLQLFPPPIMQTDFMMVPQNISWTAPAVTIRDYPRFPYRGMHLDVSRHFFGVKFIKKYIDLMATYKINRFHWHLTDDQGWRIQIKRYPKLTEIGAWRDSTIIGYNSSGRYIHHRMGGFYTQKQIHEVVAYAKNRFVTIIPEIEMPGHSGAALAAYPTLGCKQITNYHVWSKWGGGKESVYCPGNDTFHFLENVLTEMMTLFPSKYIHIGGDEVDKTAWKNSKLAQNVMKRENLKNEKQLQSYFIRRIEKFLNDHGRNIIGWDEILEGGLAPGATVESWRGIKGGIKAAQKHHKVIMAPNTYLYFNFAQANPKTEPIAQSRRRMISLEKIYKYEPIPKALTKKQATYVEGVEACLWGNYIDSPKIVEYMAYPRALALAEVAWSSKDKRHWNGFWKRLQPQFKRLNVQNVNYGEHYLAQKPQLMK